MPSQKNSKQRPTGRFPSCTSSATKPSERPAGHQNASSIFPRVSGNPMVFQKETPNLTLRRPTQCSPSQSADLENQTHSAPRPSNKRTGKEFLPTLRRWRKLAAFAAGATLLIITLLSCGGPMSMGNRRKMVSQADRKAVLTVLRTLEASWGEFLKILDTDIRNAFNTCTKNIEEQKIFEEIIRAFGGYSAVQKLIEEASDDNVSPTQALINLIEDIDKTSPPPMPKEPSQVDDRPVRPSNWKDLGRSVHGHSGRDAADEANPPAPHTSLPPGRTNDDARMQKDKHISRISEELVVDRGKATEIYLMICQQMRCREPSNPNFNKGMGFMIDAVHDILRNRGDPEAFLADLIPFFYISDMNDFTSFIRTISRFAPLEEESNDDESGRDYTQLISTMTRLEDAIKQYERAKTTLALVNLSDWWYKNPTSGWMTLVCGPWPLSKLLGELESDLTAKQDDQDNIRHVDALGASWFRFPVNTCESDDFDRAMAKIISDAETIIPIIEEAKRRDRLDAYDLTGWRYYDHCICGKLKTPRVDRNCPMGSNLTFNYGGTDYPHYPQHCTRDCARGIE